MSNICPYPGLRPFNEEESIFFKGRDTHIQEIITELERNKFLMVTGASGDGKSSLIYAGVVPNARAGFFKAKFNNWTLVDFRPERTPLKNFANSLSTHLKINDVVAVEDAIKSGFSSLVTLYKNSKFYLDTTADDFKNKLEVEQKKEKRKAANLLILVDQFEEFFTNSENYSNGQASIESQLVVNLLLETSRLALANDIPIYVVCTMRSDYIGQCAAFRGLPEFIGFSQFFVPRLKRNEIRQVITEPAQMAGCTISNRLTETLINELGDGFDQLPVLQHALNQIWKTASNGSYEMDLLHLAKIAGLQTSSLTPEDRIKHKDWFANIPEYRKSFFDNPTLENVLNAHANELYHSAAVEFNKKNNRKINDDTAKQIIKIAFQCLTKIDAARAVRNRMTLKEITLIINRDDVNEKTVDEVLDIFRVQGNTFLKPFIEIDANENKINEDLKSDDVLDITHESLIRNWQILKDWASDEYENYQTWLDFDKQLQRWVDSDYSKDFLLPIGPLTFFETWYITFKPNEHWLAKYDERKMASEQKTQETEKRLQQAQQFLHRSARSLMMTRTVLKYGANKILATIGAVVFAIAIVYYTIDFRHKQNDYVIEQIKQEGTELLKSKYASVDAKAEFIINNDRLNELNNKQYEFKKLLNGIGNDTIAFKVATSVIKICSKYQDGDTLLYDKKLKYSIEVIKYCYNIFEREINSELISLNTQKPLKLNLRSIDYMLAYGTLLKGNKKENYTIDSINNLVVSKAKNVLLTYLKSSPNSFKDFRDNNTIYTFLYLLALDEKPDYREFLKILSPYENTSKPELVLSDNSTQSDIFINCNKIPKNGTFELLSILYATEYEKNPKAKNYLGCLIDSSLTYNSGMYVPRNITDVLLKFCGNPIVAVEFVNAKSNFYKSFGQREELFWDLLCKSFFENLNKNEKYEWIMHSKIKYFIPEKNKDLIWDKYLNIITTNEGDLSKQFKLSKYFKLHGFYCAAFLNDINKAEFYFEKCLQVFESIPQQTKEFDYLEHKAKNNYESSNSYQVLWYYPDDYYEYVTNECGYTSYSNYQFLPDYSESIFLNYILKTKRGKVYDCKYGINVLSDYVAFRKGAVTKQATKLLSQIKNKQYVTVFAKEALMLNKVVNLQKEGKIEAAFNLIKPIKSLSIDNEEYIREIILNFLKNNRQQYAIKTFEKLPNENFENYLNTKAKLFFEICNKIQEGENIEYTFYFLNELEKIIERKAEIAPAYFRLLGKIGGAEIENIAQNKLRNIPEFLKPKALDNWVLGTSEGGRYYKAKKLIPENASETKVLELMNQILQAEIIKVSNKNSKNSNNGNWDDANYFSLKYELPKK